MPGFTINDPSRKFSQPLNKFPKLISRSMVIENGMDFLQKMGSDHICKVCITDGGSCCSGCRHLSNGIGCQQRNTSCTAWLCGFHKYLLYEVGLLQEWNDFWDQVPGQDFREDFTPEYFYVQKSLYIQNMRHLSEALASDLHKLAHTHIAIGYILTLREKIDKNIDQLMDCKNDPNREIKIKRNIKILSSHFHHFHKALSEYHQR